MSYQLEAKVRPLVIALAEAGLATPPSMRPWVPCFLDREHFHVTIEEFGL